MTKLILNHKTHNHVVK